MLLPLSTTTSQSMQRPPLDAHNLAPAMYHLVQCYEYEVLPAGHVRVLELSAVGPPLVDISPTSCSLRIVPFLVEPTVVPYDALPYMWRGSTAVDTLLCDGKMLRTQHNIREALPYLARRPSNLPLWIDAISINQSDEVENLEQVRLISEIYQRADHVWVWLGLGEGPGCSVAVEDIIPRMGDIAKTIRDLPEDRTIPPSQLGLPDVNSSAWTALERVLNSPWFLRLWVVQEACLA